MPQQLQHNRSLFNYILPLFDPHFQQETVWHVLARHCGSIAKQDKPTLLTTVGMELGLQIDEIAMSPLAACGASGAQTVLVRWLNETQSWLVLLGFRLGKTRVALVHSDMVEEQRLDSLAKWLKVKDNEVLDWWLIQPQAPLAEAAMHQDGHHPTPLRRLFGMLRAERKDLLLLLGLTIGIGLLSLALPIAVQALVNTVALGGVIQPLVVLSMILFIFLSFLGAIQVLQSYLVELVQRRIFVRVAADLAHRLPRVRCEVYDKNHGAELVNRFFDVMTVQKAGAALLLDGAATIMQALISLLVLAFYHPFLLAFDVVLLLAIVFVVLVLGRHAIPTAIAESKAKYGLVAWLEIVTRNMLTFKQDGGPGFALERTDMLAHSYLTQRRTHYRIVLRQVIGAVSLQALAGTALLAIGGLLVIEGQLTLGQLVAAELIVSAVLSSFAKFGKHLESYYDLMAGVDKLGHLLDLPLERERGERHRLPQPASLEVDDVHFAYSAKQPVFKNLRLCLQPGEHAAILAPPSTGKSTLADLLCGLRLPNQGHIRVAGYDLHELRLETLREQIAVVNRLEIIEDSIIENVRIGRLRVGMDEVRTALQAVGLLPEVTALPEGLATELGPTGTPLSSAQASLLPLARAIAGHPALLILDGVLDEVDTAARQHIMDALLAKKNTWTLVVLTQLPEVATLCPQTIELPHSTHP